MAKVSIIMCSYNRPKLIKQAIQSIVEQTMRDWELIIIDDCSTVTGIDEVVTGFMEKDNRIKYYKMEQNINNLTVLWNFGADASSGEYICTCDDDTMKKPDFLKKMSEFLDKNQQFEAVSCYAEIWRDEKFERILDLPSQMNKENIKTQNFCDSGSIMFRRSVFDKVGYWDERMTTCDDWDLVKRIQLETNGFGIIQEPLYIYRWVDDNRTYTAKELGDEKNHYMITNQKKYGGKQEVLFVHQKKSLLTLSQNNVLNGVLSALEHLDYVRLSTYEIGNEKNYFMYDIVFVFAPFSIKENDINEISRYGKEVVFYMIEDPQAFYKNENLAKYATYIFTNDHSTIPYYHEIIDPGCVAYCPSISYDDINLPDKPKITKTKKYKYDVLFLGTGYESRQKFISELVNKIKKNEFKMAIVGEYWKDLPNTIDVFKETEQNKVLELMNNSKIVLLKNREYTDLGGCDDSIKPNSVDRGYFEAASSAMILLDDDRKMHSFNDNEIVFYKQNDVNNCLDKIRYYLKNNTKRLEIVKNANERAFSDFTYRKRIGTLMNYVRTIRYYIEIG